MAVARSARRHEQQESKGPLIHVSIAGHELQRPDRRDIFLFRLFPAGRAHRSSLRRVGDRLFRGAWPAPFCGSRASSRFGHRPTDPALSNQKPQCHCAYPQSHTRCCESAELPSIRAGALGTVLGLRPQRRSEGVLAQVARAFPAGWKHSELAFCWIMQELAKSHANVPSVEELTITLRELAPRIAKHGTFNFLLSNGEALWAHASTRLHYLERSAPFGQSTLADDDMSIDWTTCTSPGDRATVIVTEPLTRDESWVEFRQGELKVFVDGLAIA